MDKAMLQAIGFCLLWISHISSSSALGFGIEAAIRAATFEFAAPGLAPGSKALVGTAFSIGPNEFVTAAHLLDQAIGSHFGQPVLLDSRGSVYRIADFLHYSDQQD